MPIPLSSGAVVAAWYPLISLSSVWYCSRKLYFISKNSYSESIVEYCFRNWLHMIVMKLIKVGVNPSLKKEMWLLMHLITKKTCTKMYKIIYFWNQKKQMNPMVATDFGKIMWFFRNVSVTMVTIQFFLDSITNIWFY